MYGRVLAAAALAATAAAPLPPPPTSQNPLGDALDALPGLIACIDLPAQEAVACYRARVARLTPQQRQALATFATFTRLYAAQTDSRDSDGGDWPVGHAGSRE